MISAILELVAMALLLLWNTSTPVSHLHGEATYMRSGLMEQVAVNKGLSLDGYAGAVALNRAADLGRVVWLSWEDGSVDGPLLVIDCAQRGKHFAARESQRRVVEVSYEIAQLRGLAGYGPRPVTVSFVPILPSVQSVKGD